MSIFKGAGVALLTPFNEDNTINFEELGKIMKIKLLVAQMLLLYVELQVNLQQCLMKRDKVLLNLR